MKKTLLIIMLLLLTACSDASPTAQPNLPTLSGTTTNAAAASTGAITTANATQAATTVNPTLPPQTTPSNPATTVPVATTTQAVTTTRPTNPPPTTVPATTPNVTAAPPTTAAPVQASWKAIGGANCCLDFSFAGNDRLTYYDKPANNGRAGTYSFDLKNGQATFLTDGFGTFAPDLSLAALTDRPAGTTHLQDLSQNKPLGTLSNAASQTLISPDKKQVTYLLRAAQQDGPEAPQRFALWIANADGSGARAVWNGREAANLAWLPDNRRLMLTGRDAANQKFGLWVIGTDGTATLIVESKGLTVAAPSGDGQWVAYWVTLQGAEYSGVWLAHADGSQAHKLAWQGGFRWDATNRLFYLPTRTEGQITTSQVYRYDPTTDQTTRMTDPAKLPLQVALDQWQIAPNGLSLVFRNAADNALWLITF